MELICDYREKSVYNNLIKKIESNEFFKDIILKKTNLTIGDFLIGNNIIERKTISDLASSILDGRYKEQSSRLEQYKEDNKDNLPVVMYFIEGSLDLYINAHNITKDKLISAIISLMCKKNYKVFLTRHVNETCDFLLKICKKNSVHLENDTNISTNFEKYKKNNKITNKNIGNMMLSVVPNISEHISEQLLKPFDGNLYLFLKKIHEDEEYLNTIKLHTKTGKVRALPKNVNSSIKELCFNKINC